ncbi:MAG: alpha/beta fold hydrolase [Anaerolineales bacterium]|nr:alpha/beta fold hydrolase [Anaerolineales bacterium]
MKDNTFHLSNVLPAAVRWLNWRVAGWFYGLAFLFMICGCQAGPARQVPANQTVERIAPTVMSQGTKVPMSNSSPTVTTRPSATTVEPLTPEPARTATSAPTYTQTPDPYSGLLIEDLISRSYGGGKLEILETLAVNSYFTRTLMTYPSDGLEIAGFLNSPRRPPETWGRQLFPVVIALHGYIEPEIYQTVDYTTGYADTLARAGFIVLHPNLRGYPPSDEGDNRFRVGMAVDVLNLLALVKSQAGQPGPLEKADPQSIGLWGHSMGGGIAIRVMTVNPDVRAVVLYGSMSADDQKNYQRINTYFSNGQLGLEEVAVPVEIVQWISPINYLERVSAAVSIHHGKNDPDVPLAWSLDLCNRLNQLGKAVECFTYPEQGHTFHGDGEILFMQRIVKFFDKWLRDQ